ncbi:MAG: family lipase [Daejeonella sp.]|nr:family lipase [Daejeonella sp.]
MPILTHIYSMISKKYCLIAVISLLNFSCATKKVVSNTQDVLPASALNPYGRYQRDSSQNLELISSAVHFGFSFTGKEFAIYASLANLDGHNYLQYEVDGAYQKRIRVEGNSKAPIILSVPTEGPHTVWIFKATEAHTGPIFIQKIEAKNIKAIENTTAPLIEFIGNSITCGAAADDSEVPCGTGEYHDQHNAYQAYGPRLARELKANFILSSVSGIGVYRNWNSNGPTMPQVYEKADFQESGTRMWDFNAYSPKVVSIALGTNDFSNGDGKKERWPFDSMTFINKYVLFIQAVKGKYPNAKIALLSSPMINGSTRFTLQNCLTAVKEKIDLLYPADKPVALFFFEPMQARGCSGHPNVEDHGLMANQLLPFFEKLIK